MAAQNILCNWEKEGRAWDFCQVGFMKFYLNSTLDLLCEFSPACLSCIRKFLELSLILTIFRCTYLFNFTKSLAKFSQEMKTRDPRLLMDFSQPGLIWIPSKLQSELSVASRVCFLICEMMWWYLSQALLGWIKEADLWESVMLGSLSLDLRRAASPPHRHSSQTQNPAPGPRPLES